MCYSLDFRQKVLSVRAKDNLTLSATAQRFDVGMASIARWLKRIEPKSTRDKPAVKINMQSLQEDLDKDKDSYYFERAKRLNVSTSCVFYAMKRLGVSYKKNSTASKGRQGKTSHI